jgi:hypothetical protein
LSFYPLHRSEELVFSGRMDFISRPTGKRTGIKIMKTSAADCCGDLENIKMRLVKIRPSAFLFEIYI